MLEGDFSIVYVGPPFTQRNMFWSWFVLGVGLFFLIASIRNLRSATAFWIEGNRYRIEAEQANLNAIQQHNETIKKIEEYRAILPRK